MDEVLKDKSEIRITFKDKFLRVFKSISRAFHNPTFVYILRRIVSSIFTLLLLTAVVTALLKLLPDTNFYPVKEYNQLRGRLGVDGADRWKNMLLYKAGRRHRDGSDISVLESILNYIYWILPLPKSIANKYSTDYLTVYTFDQTLSYFGRASSITGTPLITQLFTQKMGISFKISIWTTVLCYVFSIPLGIGMAKKPGGVVDKIGNIFIVLNYAIPALVFYLLMNSIMGRAASPVFGWAHFGTFYDSEKWQTLVPPIFCVTFLSIPGVSIWIRRYMVDELSSDYVKFARSKGLSETKIMYTHVLRNACVPLVRNLPATFIGAIIGSYYVEYIWSIPGTGKLLTQAISGSSPDIALVQSLTFLYAALSMVSFLLGDIITVFFDPRIRILED